MKPFIPDKVFNERLFAGQTVLVTGGGSGIGFAIARLFGQLGARVILAARDQTRLDEAARQLQDGQITATALPVNIRDPDSVRQLFDHLDTTGQTVDVLVNNAGGQFAAPALDMSPRGFQAVVDLNLQGTFQMSQRYAMHCRAAQRPGAIINIVLCLAQGMPGMAHAAAARAGVVNLTKTLAWEWAPLGIRVNAIAPGTIATHGLENYDAERLARNLERLPIPRMGSPEEVAHSAVFLASPAAAYITGICLALDGGEHMAGASPQA